jgi:hypothetical protein
MCSNVDPFADVYDTHNCVDGAKRVFMFVKMFCEIRGGAIVVEGLFVFHCIL